MACDERAPAGASLAQVRCTGLPVPRIGEAVAVQGGVGDRERVVRGLVTGAVDGGAQHWCDGDVPDHLDLIVPQLKPPPTQPDRGTLRQRQLDGYGEPEGG